ncbi:uncharacterized protein [Diabrotica undecimpunctata]|uniref:uncharacterized protein n=1 Tax=Diabrotica undecimpunctata TaxID=50387 RepID=UPI003B63236F
MISCAKKHIPRGVTKSYIPCWNDECKELLDQYEKSGDPEVGEQLLETLNSARTIRWRETLENLNFPHSSRTAWNLLRKLDSGTNNATANSTAPKPEDIGKRIANLSKPVIEKNHKGEVRFQLQEVKIAQQQSLPIMKPIEPKQLAEALKLIKCRQAAGVDNIYPEFIKHIGPNTSKWLLEYYNQILTKFAKSFKKRKIIAISKPGKDPALPESYRKSLF